jgi:hypothetical protein
VSLLWVFFRSPNFNTTFALFNGILNFKHTGITLFTNPNLNASNTIIQYVSDTYGNANTIMATVEASNFDPTKVQWA